ncbi:hypothetical protein F5890DRAFT_1534498 [Lentinula detonsa]|uniref:Uncharacterized protein n=1 Tax=Lentinula detonsa TaxID=2804962 RepID=A0AA38URP2_9AGAR|nr:hypothetical protein F5890DRAFT_1534498 [Lentinula detonsa]
MSTSLTQSLNASTRKAIQDHYIKQATNLAPPQSLAAYEAEIKNMEISPFLTFSGKDRIANVFQKVLSEGSEHMSDPSDIAIALEALGSKPFLDKLSPTGAADQLIAWLGSAQCPLPEDKLENLVRLVVNGTAGVFKRNRKKRQLEDSLGSGLTMPVPGGKDIIRTNEKDTKVSGLSKGGKRPLGDSVKGLSKKRATGIKGIFGSTGTQPTRHSRRPQIRGPSQNSHRYAVYFDNDVSATHPTDSNVPAINQASSPDASESPSSVDAQMLASTRTGVSLAPQSAPGSPSSIRSSALDTNEIEDLSSIRPNIQSPAITSDSARSSHLDSVENGVKLQVSMPTASSVTTLPKRAVEPENLDIAGAKTAAAGSQDFFPESTSTAFNETQHVAITTGSPEISLLPSGPEESRQNLSTSHSTMDSVAFPAPSTSNGNLPRDSFNSSDPSSSPSPCSQPLSRILGNSVILQSSCRPIITPYPAYNFKASTITMFITTITHPRKFGDSPEFMSTYHYSVSSL